VLAYLVALVIRLYRAIVRSDNTNVSPRVSDADSTASTTTEPSENEAQRGGTTVSTVRSVWQRFVRLVVRRVSPTQTPGEIARTAIDKGFPRGPVVRLTDAFRTAVYGPTRSERLVDEAKNALDALESESEPEVDINAETTTEYSEDRSHASEDN